MKDITFTVPCYNSEDYMERCIDSLLACLYCIISNGDDPKCTEVPRGL